ncbi:MAG: hypothetical protein ACRELB_24145 [Polyangiaceae bacterium]
MTRLLGICALLIAGAGLAACQAESPPRGLEATCAKSCEVHASQCSPHQCRRGCNLVLDRLAENEGDHVLACVVSAKSSCDDRAWAHCAVRVGPHADGGPPPPKAAPDDVLDDEGD